MNGLPFGLKQKNKLQIIMTQPKFEDLLLQTAFSCMACDSDIEKREIDLITSLEKKERLFNVENIEDELNQLVKEINQKGIGFLKEFLSNLDKASLSEDQELKIIRIALKTIESDEKVEYSEIKFFKIIRTKLNVSNQKILEKLSHINNLEEYLEQDIISDSYLKKLTLDYFSSQSIPEFDLIKLNQED